MEILDYYWEMLMWYTDQTRFSNHLQVLFLQIHNYSGYNMKEGPIIALTQGIKDDNCSWYANRQLDRSYVSLHYHGKRRKVIFPSVIFLLSPYFLNLVRIVSLSFGWGFEWWCVLFNVAHKVNSKS